MDFGSGSGKVFPGATSGPGASCHRGRAGKKTRPPGAVATALGGRFFLPVPAKVQLPTMPKCALPDPMNRVKIHCQADCRPFFPWLAVLILLLAMTPAKAMDRFPELGRPCVILLNIGSVGGPTDGTSKLCRKIDATVGPGHPGLVFVSGASDDGTAANRAGGFVGSGETVSLDIRKEATGNAHVRPLVSRDRPVRCPDRHPHRDFRTLHGAGRTERRRHAHDVGFPLLSSGP